MTQSQEHWSEVYRTKAADTVSWYQMTPEPSLRALDRFQVPNTAGLIDVGGGASNLVDRLIERGWTDLTVLDIAAPALEVARARLGHLAARVRWEVADIAEWLPSRTYDVWHDRAVFHFLITPGQREAYRRALNAGVVAGGLLIIATFAPDGPERCSGLPVQRYDAASMAKEIGTGFRLVDDWREEHSTPQSRKQSFNWCVFRRA
jgi:SAM-dependent methyltransferase